MPRPWPGNLLHWRAATGAPLAPLDGDARSMGRPLFRRPLPDASPQWCRAPKPLCRGVVRARPVRWSCAPSGGLPGVVGTVARAAATRRGRWWARWRNGLHGASVGRVCWGRCCLARGSQAGQDGDSLRLESGEWRCSLQDSAVHIPPARGRIIHPRSKLLQQLTVPTNSPNTPKRAKMAK